MSTHDAHGDASAAAHGHDDHGFDGEPAREAPPDEPRTPGWLPALGAALFVCAGVYLLVSAKDEPAAQAATPQTAHAAEAQPAPAAMPRPQQAQQPQQQQAHPIRPPPSFTAHPVAGPGAGPGEPHKLDPAEIEKLIEQRRQQQGGKPAAAP
jgi:hypothetical protein